MSDPKQVPEHLSAEERECFERLRKVSLGPWNTRSETRNTKTVVGLECAATGNDVELEQYDAEFVAHARLDIPTLLRTISELRGGLLAVHGACGHPMAAQVKENMPEIDGRKYGCLFCFHMDLSRHWLRPMKCGHYKACWDYEKEVCEWCKSESELRKESDQRETLVVEDFKQVIISLSHRVDCGCSGCEMSLAIYKEMESGQHPNHAAIKAEIERKAIEGIKCACHGVIYAGQTVNKFTCGRCKALEALQPKEEA